MFSKTERRNEAVSNQFLHRVSSTKLYDMNRLSYDLEIRTIKPISSYMRSRVSILRKLVTICATSMVISLIILTLNINFKKVEGTSMPLQFHSKHQCVRVVNNLDEMALLGSKYFELRENCLRDTDLEESYHDVLRTLKNLGEIEEIAFQNPFS